MRFANIFTGLAMAATAIASATPQQIAAGINALTQKSQALQAPAQSITILNAPLIVIGQGPFPTIIAGFADIVSTANSLIAEVGAAPKEAPEKVHARDFLQTRDAAADAAIVFDAFRAFVRVHQALLNILIGKAGILEAIPLVGAPVAAALRGVEAVVDTIAIYLINTFETPTTDFQSQANSLGASLDLCISKYQGLSI